MKFHIIAVVIVSGLFAVPAFASDQSETVQGRSEAAVEATLRGKGITVTHLEDWGPWIRGWVQNENRGSTMVFIDPDTLELVKP